MRPPAKTSVLNSRVSTPVNTPVSICEYCVNTNCDHSCECFGEYPDECSSDYYWEYSDEYHSERMVLSVL